MMTVQGEAIFLEHWQLLWCKVVDISMNINIPAQYVLDMLIYITKYNRVAVILCAEWHHHSVQYPQAAQKVLNAVTQT